MASFLSRFSSLIGLPPFGGFVGKLLVFYGVVASAGKHPAMWFVLAVGVLNTVFSLFYYVRVMKTMFFAWSTLRIGIP